MYETLPMLVLLLAMVLIKVSWSKQVLSRFPTCWIRWNLAFSG